MQQATLTFDKGSLLISGDVRVPHATWDARVRASRSQAYLYREILGFLERSNLPFVDKVQDLIPCPPLNSRIRLRSYQAEALDAWKNSGRRGVIVLPTGAGKTVVAIKAIHVTAQPSIIIVPTLDLVEQWRQQLENEFEVEIGTYGGGDQVLRSITVSTYDSAYLRAAEIGNRFNFIIFDEVHHLPAEGYRQIAEMFTAPYRMGLTATYEREDALHKELPKLTGGVVYRLETNDLTGEYLSEYTLQRITVDLKNDERIEYERHYKSYRHFLVKKRIRLRTPRDFQRFIMRTGWDKGARAALLSRNKALEIAFNSETKIDELEKILGSNPEDRILIFTQHNDLVYRISRRFLIPYITHTTAKNERAEVLTRFKDGIFRALVTSKVLDEGVDVPEASLGVVLSGTGSSREFIQRLGRLLRKKEGKQARLVEIVSGATSETKTSVRRKRTLERTN